MQDDQDSTANAFTFSLLGQLKDSLVTYDNSLKGFLDLGVQGGTDHDEGGDSDAATSDAGSTSSGRRSPRVSHASLADKKVAEELEKQLEEQKQRYQRELEEAKQSAERELENVREVTQAESEARLKDSEQMAETLQKEREEMEKSLLELESVKEGKEEMNKKVARLQKGWGMERQQAELVKQAMANQHKQ